MLCCGCKRGRGAAVWSRIVPYTKKEVATVFEVTAGRKRRMNVSVNSFCVNFILWGYLITIG
jgi:predicted Fe-S protein YdhL (DUF1289 family)